MKIISGVIVFIALSIQAIGKKSRGLYRLPNIKKNSIALVCVFLCCSWGSVEVEASVNKIAKRYYFDIPALPLRKALNQVATQSEYQLVFSSVLVGDLQTSPVRGMYTVNRVLGVLLKDSSLFGSVTERGVIVIAPLSAQITTNEGMEIMNTKKSILASTIAMFMSVGAGGVMAAEAAEQVSALDEIIVTATKRETSLQDTAISISAIGGDEIDKRNLVGMADYLSFIPGVTMHDRGAGQNDIVIRGTSLGNQLETNSASGIYFGETSVTGLGTATTGSVAGSADIKMVDIERVEVLRGPQGTLYGAGSMGGTVRVVPNKPELTEIEGKIAARYSQTGERGGDNTMVQGVINLPIIDDQLAVRAVGYQFDNDGYIDNIAGSQSDSELIAERIALGGVANDRKVGGDKYTGARLSALWQPIEAFSATLSYLNQEIEQIGSTEVDANISGDFQQIRMAVDGARGEFLDNQTEIVNLILEYDLGWGSLFSSTSDTDYKAINGFDFSLFSVFPAPRSSLGVREVDSFAEEIRFVSAFEGPLQMLLGYYYEDKDDLIDSDNDYRGTLPTSPPEAFGPSRVATVVTSKQKALFGELSYDFGDQFTATFGFRAFDYDLSRPFSERNGVTRDNQGQSGGADGTTYKFNLSYRPNDDTLLYAQWAEGFRMGDFQSIIDPERDDPDGDGVLQFVDGVSRKVDQGILDPDTTETYEIGLKTSLIDNRVALNTAVFRTNWEGLPLGVEAVNGGPLIFFNLGKSTVEGIELEVKAQLTDSLVANLNTSYIEAVLAEDAIQLGGEKGESLPGSTDFNLSLGLEHQFSIAEYSSYIRADYSYVDELAHVFKTNLVEGEAKAGDYSTLDLKVGMKINDINVDIYAKNLTNSDKFTWVDSFFGQFGGKRAFRQKPRTIGVNVSYRF